MRAVNHDMQGAEISKLETVGVLICDRGRTTRVKLKR